MDEPIEQIPQPDWVDQDLLTKDLAGSLLDTEIRAEQARIDALDRGETPTDPTLPRATMQHRLDAMIQLRTKLPHTEK